MGTRRETAGVERGRLPLADQPAAYLTGALAVIYAQRVSDIAKLTKSDVLKEQGSGFLRIGDQQVWMPEPLGGLPEELPWRRQVGISGKLPYSKDWLFPAGRPATICTPSICGFASAGSESIAGIREGRPLLQLAAEVPAAVLADMLRLADSTATEWVEWAGGNWTSYAAMRSSISPDGRKQSHVST